MSITIERPKVTASPVTIKDGNKRSLRQVTRVLGPAYDFEPGVVDSRENPEARQGKLPQDFKVPDCSVTVIIDSPWSSLTNSNHRSFTGLLASHLRSDVYFKVTDSFPLEDSNGETFLVCAVTITPKRRHIKPA